MDHFNRLFRKLFITLLMIMLMPIANASPMDEWKGWALDSHPDSGCPWVMSSKASKSCIWPGKLTIAASNKGAIFELSATIFEKNAFLQLPGDTRHWPLSVTINGTSAPVVERNQRPHVSLTAGQYTIKGLFEWQRKPGKLTMPNGVAIISLVVDGKSSPANFSNGQLIFSNKSSSVIKQSRDSLQLEVYRKLIDGVPVTLETVIKLSVSGKPRELTFGRVLLEGNEILSMQSPIPARVESDGTMRGQVIPGEYQIKLISRFLTNPENISIEPLTAEWPTYEFFSFESNPSVRQAKLSGPISIDTTQISMPNEWSGLPTYRLGKADVLTISTDYRGDHSPAANELSINRDLWLDFNGSGITSLDYISGSMNKDWRLNAAKGSSIGRATVDDEPVLITSLDGTEGIEIRSPAINLTAVTRVDSSSKLSVAGWDARADQYRSTLHLPPGWRVLHASGVDRITGTWISKWDLWDIFLVLVIVAATRKLISTQVSVLAAVAMLLTYHEPGNPILLVPLLLIIIALLPVVSGTLKSLLSRMSILFAAALVLALIAFAVSTFRLAIYPTLERSSIGEYSSRYDRKEHLQSAPAVMFEDAMEVRSVGKRLKSKNDGLEEVVVTAQKRAPDLYQVSENDKVQTGPGLPTWTWNATYFEASGPVPANQQLSIMYSSPVMTSLWRILSVFLAAFYALLVLIKLSKLVDFSSVKKQSTPVVSSVLVGILLSLVSFSSPQPAQAENFPPKYLLDELEQRLTKPPSCLPGCASLNNGRINIREREIEIQFNAYVDANIALPLPSGRNSWQLKQVLVDGRPAALRSDNGLYVQLDKGRHSVKIISDLTSDNASISLPVPIHNIKTQVEDWILEGIVDGRVLRNTLTLRSIDEQEKKEVDTLKPDPIAAFVLVNRNFSFGKQWRVTTTVTRQAPKQGALSMTIPLLANEKLLADVGTVANGAITLQLGHRQQRISWVSALEPTDKILLTSAANTHYLESWTFAPSSLWRLNYDGIPPVKMDGQYREVSTFVPTFKPWSGESLEVSIRKPEGVAGPTHTVENATLTLNAGNQIQRSNLELAVRSSLGEDYLIQIPDNSEVLAYSIDGKAMNIPTGNSIKVPLQPGLQNVSIEFQELIPIGMMSTTPTVLLPDGATNIELIYRLPRDRWPLYVSGPSIGPAMLYWGVLCVIILGAIALPILATKLNMDMPISLAGWLLLGFGLSTVNGYGVLILAIMFFLLAARKQFVLPNELGRMKFNLLQCFIVFWIIVAAINTVSAIPMGLLSNPEMKVVGNGSSSHYYKFYQDIAGTNEFPTATVISVPILAYRIVMLLWSLWFVTRIINWAGWAWNCFSEKETWMPKKPPAKL